MNAVTNGESREILLVAHPGRRDITETAKRVGRFSNARESGCESSSTKQTARASKQ